ncbi:MAG: ATP-grasp domain-containing protein [Chitinophagales bacterium]|nr:ATP-grasp domain-containing protein [Chitinophagales bacterium]
MEKRPLNFLCISTYFKGEDFLRSCKAEGNRVFLLTLKSLENEDWPWDSIDETLYVDKWVDEHVQNGIAYKFRSIKFDRFVALDDFDVEKAAGLREHFRMPGMGQTTGRFFRDKLAMRVKAHEEGIKVPPFSSLFHDEDINSFADSVQAPWLVKPRHEASAHGIKKVHSKDDLWQLMHELGDDRHKFLVEKFAPGDVYHVDSINYNGDVVFARVSKYLDTPYEVAHGGGIFRSVTIELNSQEEQDLRMTNRSVMKAFGMQFGASHTEFIRSRQTGEIFFLETSSRVGGANLSEMVEAATGLNLWAEWAKVESVTFRNEKYTVPKLYKDTYAGIVVSLSRYEYQDLSTFTDPEIVWRMHKPWHIGLIVSASSQERVEELLNKYTRRIAEEYHASAPPPEKSV